VADVTEPSQTEESAEIEDYVNPKVTEEVEMDMETEEETDAEEEAEFEAEAEAEKQQEGIEKDNEASGDHAEEQIPENEELEAEPEEVQEEVDNSGLTCEPEDNSPRCVKITRTTSTTDAMISPSKLSLPPLVSASTSTTGGIIPKHSNQIQNPKVVANLTKLMRIREARSRMKECFEAKRTKSISRRKQRNKRPSRGSSSDGSKSQSKGNGKTDSKQGIQGGKGRREAKPKNGKAPTEAPSGKLGHGGKSKDDGSSSSNIDAKKGGKANW